MTSLTPQLLGNLGDWFAIDNPFMNPRLIRVEEEKTDDEYRLRAELPGVDPAKEIQVSVDDDILTVRAERHDEVHTHHRSEFQYGILHRSMRLPKHADTDNVTAEYRQGILDVRVPLRSSTTRKEITVNHD